MVQTALDTATLKAAFDTAFLKAALLQLVQEDPAFLQNLLAAAPNGAERIDNRVEESPAPNYGGIPNTKLDALIQLNFERYDETFRKLA